jgi:hypothetical protein
MNRFSKVASKVVVAAATAVAAGAAFAQQAAPTTATQLAQAVDMSDAKAAGLVIIGLIIACGVVLWGARLVAAKFAPKV